MNYTADAFKNCLFNPFETEPFDYYPQLRQIIVRDPHDPDDEDHVWLPLDKVIRYIIAMYDPRSPLIKGEQNVQRRKEIAAEIAGFDGEEEAALDIVYNHRYDCMVEMIQNFLKDLVKSMEWGMLVGFECTFWEYQLRLIQPIERGDKDKDLMSAMQVKTKIVQDITQVYEKYQAALKSFYGEEDALIEGIAKIKRFTPEQIAKAK